MRHNLDFSKSKIYIIRSPSTEKVYVGSTCSTLTVRFSEHKSGWKRWVKKVEKNKDYTSYNSSFDIIRYGDAFIELLEEYPCVDNTELRKRECVFISSTNHAVNRYLSRRRCECGCMVTKYMEYNHWVSGKCVNRI